MPKETKTTIWVVGAEGSGKTTLITIFPMAALRLTWILLPDQNTARYIYGWQHDLFSNGIFPPRGDAQRSKTFSFNNFKPIDWEVSQLGNGPLRTQRNVTVVEHTLSTDYDNVAFEEELKFQANTNEEFGIVYCLDLNQPDDTCISHLQDIVKALGETKGKKPRRLCLAFTKADILARPQHLGDSRRKVFDDEYPWGVESDRRQTLNILTNNVFESLQPNLGVGAAEELKEIISGARNRTERLDTSIEVCTAVGVAKDQDDNYRPNVQDSDVGLSEVYERHQLWWSGIDRVFMRAHGAMPTFN